MTIRNETDLINLIKEDEAMMNVLRIVKSLDLPDWWVCAGFVRSKIWDVLHGFNKKTVVPDIDVIYFYQKEKDESKDEKLEEKLRSIAPHIPWSVKNQARMHKVNDFLPYSSSFDAISKFPETATALGIKLSDWENVILAAPYGIEDAINLQIKPTPSFINNKKGLAIHEERIVKKDWKSTWNKIEIHHL
ncbi:nucleotidyltransferase family protein [Halobacillus shinanisalinarum]|uniref:Nucleotidyltransferase family protein n=1 Tax=Halobacillus shinanisalinarum TaxID=2932258 RepID=A0ABY4H533_9BACI|nr:nucleotidyltransferase family protein [Halobacillus shinanisalinarum]UOQ95015.1 nucleotidyltransferase family protein [Halobacillus shinanisalinarum]